MQLVAAPSEHFVRIGLMSHVPDEAVIRCIEYVMKRNRQLHGAKTGGEMAAAGADALDQELPQFFGQQR